MLHDLRDAVRILRSNSSFTLVAVVVLALGIGFSVAISVVNAVFFRPRAVVEPNRLVHIFQLLKDLPRPVPLFANGVRYLRDHNDSFSGLTGHWGTSEILRSGR